ncbi:uncharacterized membrane protein (DUF2068 family) [Vulcaniibacterium tengchongense]|uniref:Uncharacterized membrane protein (DUF2068 family) n=1 Tax=Vulcaniibacterium tengchongense TaxID=1273429 RepID=A0A3N4V2Y7_9GAMM|nr:uncharacterized membrane protein (DUF2068 family) [Vulcaniibacterium tengchongense]
MSQAAHDASNPQARPGLRAIALVEAGKGLLALLAVGGLELLGPTPLQRWLHALIAHFHLDPDRGAQAWLAQAINPDGVRTAAALGLGYAALRLLEAWGLWRARAWASWLGCLGAAAYLPLDALALARHPGALSAAVLALNLLVVAALARDLLRRRRPPPRTRACRRRDPPRGRTRPRAWPPQCRPPMPRHRYRGRDARARPFATGDIATRLSLLLAALLAALPGCRAAATHGRPGLRPCRARHRRTAGAHGPQRAQ